MNSHRRLLIIPMISAICACTLPVKSVLAQARTYNVQWTNTAPTINGAVGAGEWSAAGPAQGDWRELRQAETDVDTANNRLQMMWDANGLYILYQVNQTSWLTPLGGGNPNISFGDDNLNLYIDPNADNEMNFVTNPDGMADGYQLAFNQYQGTFVSTNADRQGVGFFTEAHVNTEFGDQANWNRGGSAVAGAAMQSIVVAQKNDNTGGLAEIFIPWSNFNADAGTPPTGDYNRNGAADAADYTQWRDTLGQVVELAGDGADGDMSGTIDQGDYTTWRTAFGTAATPGTSGLYHPMAPDNNDTWFYQMGQITTADPNNFLPVYNWTSSQFFATHPHAEITFVGRPAGAATAVPEPATAVLLMFALASAALFGRNR